MKIETIYDYSILKVDWLSFDCPWLKWLTFRWCQQETGREKTETWKTKWKSAIRLSDTYTSRIHQKWCQIQKKNGKKNWSNVLTTQSTWSDLQGKQRNLSILVNPVFLWRKTCQINASINSVYKNGIWRFFFCPFQTWSSFGEMSGCVAKSYNISVLFPLGKHCDLWIQFKPSYSKKRLQRAFEDMCRKSCHAKSHQYFAYRKRQNFWDFWHHVWSGQSSGR